MTTKRRTTIITILLCFFTAFSFLAFQTRSSFLYGMQDWVDDNLFLTVGRGILAGKVLYVDIFDHKGLYLYLFYGLLGVLFPNATNPFLGIYFLEVICATFFLYITYRILSLFSKNTWTRLGGMVVTAVLTYGGVALKEGGAAEEFLLPFLAYGLYTFLKLWMSKEEMPFFVFFVNGLMAGLVLWWKFTVLGFWIGWCAILGIACWVRHGFLKAFYRMLTVLLGMAVASTPAFLYFLMNGALSEMIRIYFKMNLTGYSKPMGIREKIEVWVSILTNYRFEFLLLLGGFTLFSKRAWSAALTIAGLFAVTTFFIYFGALTHDYYFIPLSVFYSITALEIFEITANLFRSGQKLDRTTLVSCLVASIILSLYFALSIAETLVKNKITTENYTLLLWPILLVVFILTTLAIAYGRQEKDGMIHPQKATLDRVTVCLTALLTIGFSAYFIPTTQYDRDRLNEDIAVMQIARKIKEENATLLCYYSYDWGVYALSDTLLINNHFCIVNVEYYKFPELMHEQWSMVENEVTDYLLVCSYQYPKDNGLELMQKHYELCFESNDGGIPFELWKRK